MIHSCVWKQPIYNIPLQEVAHKDVLANGIWTIGDYYGGPVPLRTCVFFRSSREAKVSDLPNANLGTVPDSIPASLIHAQGILRRGSCVDQAHKIGLHTVHRLYNVYNVCKNIIENKSCICERGAIVASVYTYSPM
jgi:hypothetical protein